ncbi:hypothetical protein PM082_022862 [Marasmius tenuissimus]|nr:hypothetical protein PM082_022862 [Marasmius tenuissimus]
MDPGLASLVLAKCKVTAIDKLYENPPADSPCTCPTCTNSPPASRVETCNCSGCVPEAGIASIPKEKKKKDNHSALTSYGIELPKQHKRLSQVLRAHGTRELKAFRMQLFRMADPQQSAFLAPELFFTNQEIKLVLDYFASIKNVDHVGSLMKGNSRFNGNEGRLWARLCVLEGEFAVIREEEKKRKVDEKKRKANEVNGSEQEKKTRTSDEA